MSRVAVVTGAASGIGRATAQMLLEQGHSVAGWDLRIPDLRFAERLEPRAISAAVDVTDPDSVQAATELTLDTFGDVDLLVNAAGIYQPGGLADTPLETVRALFDVNVIGTATTTRSMAPSLARRQGAVVNVASVVATKPAPASAYYAASKAAVAQLTRSWALELAEHGVRVNAVAPGVVDTPLFATAGLEEKDVHGFLSRRADENPMGRVGQPQEVARWILRLGLEDEWVTGAILPVDGGMALT